MHSIQEEEITEPMFGMGVDMQVLGGARLLEVVHCDPGRGVRSTKGEVVLLTGGMLVLDKRGFVPCNII